MRKLTEEDSLERIESTGALRKGHFDLTSRRHSGYYVTKDDVSARPEVLDILAAEIADQAWGNDVEVVAAPAVGAIVLGNRVAFHYGPQVISIFAEQDGDEFVFKRDYARFIQPGTLVLVVEDIITTGKTTKAMIRAVEALGGKVVGVGLLWNRGTEEFSVPVFACVTRVFPTYEQKECPFCREGLPINTDVGHGKSFLTEFGADPKNWPANNVSGI